MKSSFMKLDHVSTFSGKAQQATLHRRTLVCLRGRQYASYAYQELLREYGMTPSMSRSGNCYDNAYVESFFGTLKTELVHGERYRTRLEARLSIFEYVEVFYNRQRSHSALGYRSPEQYEKLLNET